MVPDHTTLRVPLRGQTMITTSTGIGEEKEEIFLIGGLNKPTFYTGSDTIYQLMKDNADNKTNIFKDIPANLKYGRAYHIALPISYELAKESCQGHLMPKKVSTTQSKSKP